MSTTDHTTGPCTIVPVTLLYEGDDLDDIEATDAVIISDKLESVDVGGGGALHGVYLRITGPDLIAAADGLRRLADRIIDAVLDARQDKADAERHDCWCGVRLEADETTCGARACDRNHADDMAGLIP